MLLQVEEESERSRGLTAQLDQANGRAEAEKAEKLRTLDSLEQGKREKSALGAELEGLQERLDKAEAGLEQLARSKAEADKEIGRLTGFMIFFRPTILKS